MRITLFLLLSILSTHLLIAAPQEKVGFNRDIRPILSENCYYCHGPDEKHREEDLRLDIREEAIKAGAITPGNPEKSELIVRVFSDDEEEIMPQPKTHKVLTAEQKDLLKRWVAEGAEYEAHWAFTAPQHPPVPAVKSKAAAFGNGIDAFILQKLEKENITLAAPADPHTLIRRVTFDLTGLPPSPADVNAFVNACRNADGSGFTISKTAYEALVDRLLASPTYGENMARQWLDYARYADSHGFQTDSSRTMWPWRDWVIRAFNENKPFDQFTIEQLAGDLLPNPTNAQVVATGFHRNHRINGEGGLIPEEWRIENIIDRVDTTGATWLGLTLGCARCHDHKYDPISQKEFYQMFSFFNNIAETGVAVGALNRSGGNLDPMIRVGSAEQIKQAQELQSKIDKINATLKDAEKKIAAAQSAWEKSKLSHDQTPAEIKKIIMSGGKRSKAQKALVDQYYRSTVDPTYKQIVAEREQLIKQLNSLDKSTPLTMVMKELPTPRKAFILKRGQYTDPGEEVTANTPVVLPPLPAGAPRNRLTLAQWIVSPTNPLTARVWVNRQWEHFFGYGIVKTSENFGMQSDPPSHPELLDWLASEFISSGWNMKAMMKRMVMSATYRQASLVKTMPKELLEKDPYNRLLARAPRLRLPAEAIRDQALSISGLLDRTIGGPSVRPYMPKGVWDETSVYGDLRNYQHDANGGLYRRSLYTIWKRTAAPPSMLIFDSSPREICTVKRSSTNTPLQALALLNESTYVEAARVLAQRMMLEGGKDPAQRIAWAFRQATQRDATSEEMAVLQKSFQQSLATYRAAPTEASKLIETGESPIAKVDPIELAAYTVTANVILNLDEVITRD
jgi:Protein of unknown function (DUF1553)/Protein of unknown function (DUF1549)/Planctomycete cytochrome C